MVMHGWVFIRSHIAFGVYSLWMGAKSYIIYELSMSHLKPEVAIFAVIVALFKELGPYNV